MSSGFGFVLASCGGGGRPPGPTGATGLTGPQGAAGLPRPARPPGEAGTPGTSLAGFEGGAALPSSCLSPCHGFNGIVEQWKTSTHYSAFISNLGGTEVATWTGATACGNCHSSDALEQRVAGNVT